MKRIPSVSEFENDIQSLKSLLQEMGKIIYKYDFDDQSTEEEYINNFLNDFDIDKMKQKYESCIKEHTT